MLNVLRFAGVFKKLDKDLTKYLGRLAAADGTALNAATMQKDTRTNSPQYREKDSHGPPQFEQLQRKSQLPSPSQPARPRIEPSSRSASRDHFGEHSASAASAQSARVVGGNVFGNCSTLADLASSRTSSASARAAHVQRQQTATRELRENIEVSDCDQAVGSMSAAEKHQQTEAEALKAAASAASSNESCPGASSPADILKFLELVGSLKHIKRTGWVMRNVKDCESISGHMYRMGMMTYLLDGKDGLDRTKCLELAMVHDLAECVVGDITPFCGISREEKKMRELQAMEDICKLIEPYGRKVLELFQEYENAETAESKFVKDLDRLDMVLQAFEYEKRDNCVLKHQEFFDSTDGKFEHPFVRHLIDEINTQRRTLAAQKQTNLVAENGESTTNGYTNGHHVDGVSNGHDEDVSGAKKASTS